MLQFGVGLGLFNAAIQSDGPRHITAQQAFKFIGCLIMFYEDYVQEQVMNAYHRKIARHEKKTGEMYPLIRKSCVRWPGYIYNTDVFTPQVMARFKRIGSSVKITLRNFT